MCGSGIFKDGDFAVAEKFELTFGRKKNEIGHDSVRHSRQEFRAIIKAAFVI